MREEPDGARPSECRGDACAEKHKTWLDSFLTSRPLLCRMVGRIVRPEEVEDIVQETFVLSYAASRKKKISNPCGFMMTIARNVALNLIKRADKKRHFALDELPDDDFEAYACNVEQRCQSDEMFLYFCRAVAELPVDCRRVFILKKVYGLTQDEVAERMGISPRTVEKHVAKGMAMTGKYMVANGYWEDSELDFAVALKLKDVEGGAS
jgi:RNA polymerase sigma-70 factor (ECF subfamily)